MLQLSAFQAVRSSRGAFISTGSRLFSSIPQGEQPAAAEVHRSRVEADGKVYTFAVVATALEKSQSPLPAWSHACSLLASDASAAPTLAVAFVSRSTPSSAAAVAEISRSFAEMARLDDPKLSPPLIGCVGDLWAAGAPASTSPDGGGERGKAHGKLGSKRSAAELAVNAVVNAADEVNAADSEEEDFKDLVGECARWSRVNPGTVPEEESQALSSLDKELEARKSEQKMILEESGGGTVVASKKADQTVLESKAEAGDAGGSTCGPGTAAGGGSRASHSDSVAAAADDGYRLVLCVAHMPETKVTPFYSATTGVPNLPDMETAILRNNPHMFLLGAPGYPFPEFVQRLSTLFPESGRLQSRCISVTSS